MPIYDLGYRRWERGKQPAGRRWAVIARRGIALLARNRRFTMLLILSLAPFVVRVIMLYLYFFSEGLHLRIPLLSIDAKFYFDFLRFQSFPIFLMLLYAGSGLIANDLRCNALQIYFSKPLTKLDYVLGKLGVIGFFTLAVTLVPALVLFLLHLSFADSSGVVLENLWLLGPIVLFSLVLAGINSLVILALSAMSRSSRFVGLSFFALFFCSEALAVILRVITRDTHLGLVSLQTNLWRVGEALFGLAPQFRIGAVESAAVLLAVLLVSAAIVAIRIRPVEIVK